MINFDEPSSLPYQLPEFDKIELADLVPAFRTGVDDHSAQIAAIADNPAEPTWENTLEALEESGQMLNRVLAIIFNYSGTMATEEVRDIEAAVSPELAKHFSKLFLNEKLWQRIQQVEQTTDIEEGSEPEALLKFWRRKFIRGGAQLDADGRAELQKIDERLAELSTSFGRVLQEQTENAAVLLTDEAELEGLDQDTKDFLAKDAKAANKDGWLIRLGLPSVQPILESLANPDARRKVYDASVNRAGDANDATLIEIAQLRARRAGLLGYRSHADFVVEEETAGSIDAVEDLLGQVTPAAVANAHGEYKELVDKQSVDAKAAGASEPSEPEDLTAADWAYWSGKLKEERLSVNDAELRKYFPLDQVLVDGAFYAAERLYGIEVVRRDDLRGYHPEALVWEIKDANPAADVTDPGIGLLITDMYARPTKRGGAWMSSFVDQSDLLGTKPVVVNVLNVAKPADLPVGEIGKALLSMDEVATVFHEFGHALHGLLSEVRYPSLSGTSVPRDFVEFPSQINENWALQPEILANYAKHVDTGEVLSAELADAVQEQAKWGQGFATTEYVGACWVDLAWHQLTEEEAAKVTDVAAFEREALDKAGIDIADKIAPRYRSAYFNHIFAGGYSADYWSYLWAEVLDADGFQAFVDTGAAHDTSEAEEQGSAEQGGGVIDEDDVRFAGERFRRMILSRGATIDYEDAFWMFRGRQRSVEPLLRRRGLAGAGSANA